MRKIVVILLALVLALGMGMTAFAANPKIKDQVAEIADIDAGERRPGFEIRIPLVKEAFDGATEDLTMTDVRNSKIDVKHTVRAGAKAIESVTIKADSNKMACIAIKLVEPYADTKPVDFETNVYLTINGKRQSYPTNVIGTLLNSENTVDSDTDYVDLSGGQVAVCEETTRNKVEVALDDDISIFVRMTRGKSYYGSVVRGPEEEDDDLIMDYPDIEDVFTLTTIGLNGSGKTVQFNNLDDFYVYDKDLTYLGMSNDLLTYSPKYYLSSVKLKVAKTKTEDEYESDFEDEDEYEDVLETDEEGVPVDPGVFNSVGSTSNSDNRSANPNTGATPLFGASIAAGIVSLAAMILLSKKTK